MPYDAKIILDALADQAVLLEVVKDAKHRKQCNICMVWKYPTSFHIARSNADGRKNHCKECAKKLARQK